VAKKPQAKKGKARVLVIDDHPAVRSGLKAAINATHDLQVCGEAGNVREAKQILRELECDVVLLDLTLADESGLELVKDLAVRKRAAPTLVLSMHDEAIYAERVLRAGAKGYLMKDVPLEEVLRALRQVLAGEVHLSEAMRSRLLARMVGGGSASATTSPIESLTDRELEVFEAIGRGRRTGEIAEALHLSPRTIDTHRENIKRKLGLTDSTELHQHAFDWVRREDAGEGASAKA